MRRIWQIKFPVSPPIRGWLLALNGFEINLHQASNYKGCQQGGFHAPREKQGKDCANCGPCSWNGAPCCGVMDLQAALWHGLAADQLNHNSDIACLDAAKDRRARPKHDGPEDREAADASHTDITTRATTADGHSREGERKRSCYDTQAVADPEIPHESLDV